MSLKIAIIGGGIGGLTAALSLHEAGIEVQVFEASGEMKPLGVGINLLPHAVRELTELGLGEQLAAIGVATRELIYTNTFGQRIWHEDRGQHAGYRWPQYSIHRGNLQMLLWQTALARLGPQRLHSDHALASLRTASDGVSAQFVSRSVAASSGSRGQTVATENQDRGSWHGDVLIGADGIHSALRRGFYPHEGPPRWAGNMMWRMTVELPEPLLGGSTMFSAGTGDIKVVGYEISAAAKRRGRSLCNWIAEVKLGNAGDTPPEREDWNRVADIAEFVDYFRDWVFDWLDVPALARASGQAYAFPMVDRDPLPRWTQGRVTLLGDAAHPMWPIGSNGASQSVLDSRALVTQLESHADPRAALAAYEAIRRPATAAVVTANRTRAHDEILDLVQARAPQGFSDVHQVVSAAEIEASLSKYRQTAQFDKQQLQ